MFIKYSIRFFLHKRRENQESCGVRMRVRISKQPPIDFPLGQNILFKDWDVKKQRAIGNDNQSHDINYKIDSWLAALNECFARYSYVEKRVPTNEELKELFYDIVGKSNIAKDVIDGNDNNIIFVIDKFIQFSSIESQWTSGTLKMWRCFKSLIHKFRPSLKMSEVDAETLKDFVFFLNNEGYNNSTTAQRLSSFKTLLLWAHSNGFYFGDAHEKFKPRIKGALAKEKTIIYLTYQELETLYNLEIPVEYNHLEVSKDAFIFCCFTGLRFSDVFKLQTTDFKNDYFDFVTQKTRKRVRIELNNVSKSIYQKYAKKNNKNNKLFTTISSCKANRDIREICKLAGINSDVKLISYVGNMRIEKSVPKYDAITFHTSRKTFVITALQLGIPAEVIMRWTGHSSFEALRPYFEIVDSIKKQAMTKFDVFGVH